MPLQSTEEQDTQSCLVWVCAVPDSPPRGRLKVVKQAGVDHSTAWWSWDQYVLQLSQFNSSQGKNSWVPLAALFLHRSLLWWWSLRPVVALTAAKVNNYKVCCTTSWVPYVLLSPVGLWRSPPNWQGVTGKDWQGDGSPCKVTQGGGDPGMNLPLTVSVDYFWVLFSSLLGSLYLCVQYAFRDTTAACPQYWSVWADHKIVIDVNTKLLCDIPWGLGCKIQSWKVTYEDS